MNLVELIKLADENDVEVRIRTFERPTSNKKWVDLKVIDKTDESIYCRSLPLSEIMCYRIPEHMLATEIGDLVEVVKQERRLRSGDSV